MKKNKLKNMKKIISIIIILLIGGLSSFPAIIASPTLRQCDVNRDGKIDLSDLVEISKYMGQTGTPGWIRADVDKNGIVNVCDMMFVANYYGNTVNQNEMARLKKLSIAYGNTLSSTSNQEFIAKHFDMVACTSSYPNAVANVKTLNPDIKTLCYSNSIFMYDSYSDWSYVNQYENWFVHDKNGNRIKNAVYGSYLMNPNSGWSNYLAQQNKVFLQSYPQYDGVFADDTPLDLVEAGYSFNVPFTSFPTSVLTNWRTWMLQHIQNLQTTIGSKLIMPNAWIYTQFCENITGIHVWEGFVHGQSHDLTQSGYRESYILKAINLLNQQAQRGNIIAVISGTKNADDNPTEARRIMLFTMICFLFAVEDMDKSYYAWNFFNDDASHGWNPEMDYEFGEPLGAYYNVQGSVYARRFENATVVANLSPSTSYTVSIDGTSYTIRARRGRIIPK